MANNKGKQGNASTDREAPRGKKEPDKKQSATSNRSTKPKTEKETGKAEVTNKDKRVTNKDTAITNNDETGEKEERGVKRNEQRKSLKSDLRNKNEETEAPDSAEADEIRKRIHTSKHNDEIMPM
jgi:hypothetical protein